MFSVYHDQKDGSEFPDVTLASEVDNDNSDYHFTYFLDNIGTVVFIKSENHS